MAGQTLTSQPGELVGKPDVLLLPVWLNLGLERLLHAQRRRDRQLLRAADADVGDYMKAQVTATNSAGSTATWSSGTAAGRRGLQPPRRLLRRRPAIRSSTVQHDGARD